MDNTSTASLVKATGSTSDQASSCNREYFSRVYWGVKSCFGGNLHPKPEHIIALQEELVSTKKQYDDACDQVECLTKDLRKRESQATRVQKSLEKKWRQVQLENRQLKKEREDITLSNIAEKNRLRAQIEDLREEKFQVKTNLRTMNIDFSSVKTENATLKDRICDLTSQLQTSSEKEKELRDRIQVEFDNSLAHQREVDTLTAHLSYSKENVVTLEVRLAFMGARLREEEWTRKRMEGEITSKDILLDELWSEVYSPSDKSIVVRELRQARGENEKLQSSLNQSNAKVADLHFKVATLTPLPADEDEVIGASVGNDTLVVDENEVFPLEAEVTKTLCEKEGIIEELSERVEQLSEHLLLAMDDAIAAESELLEVEERCSRLENEKEILSSEVAKSLIAKDVIIEELSERVEELSEQLSLVMDDAIAAESGLFEVEERCSTLENEKEIISKELDIQRAIVESLTSKLNAEAKLNEKVVVVNKDLRARIDTLEEVNDAMAQKVDTLEDNISRVDQEREALRVQVNLAAKLHEESLLTFNAKVALLEKAIEANKTAAQKTEGQLDEDLKRARAKLSAAERKLIKAEESNAQLQSQILELEESLRGRDGELKEAKTKIGQLENAVQALEHCVHYQEVLPETGDEMAAQLMELPSPAPQAPSTSTVNADRQVVSSDILTTVPQPVGQPTPVSRTYAIQTYESGRSHPNRRESSRQANQCRGQNYTVLANQGGPSQYPQRFGASRYQSGQTRNSGHSNGAFYGY
ncbi:hypothetical protein FRC03_000677 [Tulasnella sp. 419]|nr:hypothetical protein FRC03_000677 [Tulasnella sp. 419]